MKTGVRRLLPLIAMTALLCAALSVLPTAAPAAPPTGTSSPADTIEAAVAGGGVRGQTVKSWEFERFDSDIQVHDDGSFTVRETQVINFTGSFSFITRDISTRTAGFDEGRTYGKVRVKDVEVFNLDGTPYEGSWEADSYAGGELIRIEFQAQDEQRGWIISYRMQGAMVYAEDYDRLYWNAVTYDRAVPIKHSRITVSLPEGTPMGEVEFTDYYTHYTPDSYRDSGRDGDVLWWETEDIYPYTDFTIDVSIPKGVIQKPWPYRTSTLWLMLGLAAVILLAAILLMLALWSWKGRDTYGGPSLEVSYEPPHELRPAVMAMLVHQQPKLDDVSATVVDLAVRGKLRIIEEPEEVTPGRKEFVFERKDASSEDLLNYERSVMNGLFEKGERVDEEDVRLGERLMPIMNAIRDEVKKSKFFHDDPEKTVSSYFRWGMALIILPPIVLFFLRFAMDLGYVWLLLVGTVPAGIAIWAIGHAMPQRTALGSRLYWQAMSFREYLKTAEAGEPESMTLQSFQENLPYAMVLGMADKWATLFAGVLTTPPDWYAGSGPGFSTTSLTSSLSGMATVLYIGGMPVSSGSSGGSSFDGGFSSGGFGGGSSGGGFGGGGSSAG